jgi:hypothetical protein
VTLFVDPVGPEFELQLIPVTPVTDQVAVPVGVAPPVGPLTVAVKVKVEPKNAVGELAVTATVGVTLEIMIPYGELGPKEE